MQKLYTLWFGPFAKPTEFQIISRQASYVNDIDLNFSATN
jgi:hypothetical protein